jgi:hypothetical protein
VIAAIAVIAISRFGVIFTLLAPFLVFTDGRDALHHGDQHGTEAR